MKTRFLVCGNKRSGTTFLQGSLSRLSDVETNYELLCYPTEFAAGPYHASLPLGYPVRCFLDGLSADHSIVGSKLVMGSNIRILKDKNMMEMYIDSFNDIKIIHIVRDYFEILVSSTASFVHNVAEGGGSDVLRNVRHQNSGKKARQFRMTNKKAQLSIFNYLVSDMIIAEISRRNDSIVVRYEEISRALKDIFAFIGSNVSEKDIHEITEKPATIPTRLGDANRLEDPEELARLAGNAMRLRDRSLAGEITLFEALSFRDGKMFIEIR